MQNLLITRNAEETKHFAEEFGSTLHGGDIVLLYGNLGAGKTTFVQGLAKGLGITHRITSPTFIVLRTYEVGTKNQEIRVKNFYHGDLYRLQGEKEIEDIGLLDVMGKEENIVVIEWPEKLGSLMPKKRWEIHFIPKAENEREIQIKRLSM